MARTKNATKKASIDPQAEWLKKLRYFEDGEFADVPAAQLVKAYLFACKTKPELTTDTWLTARAVPLRDRLDIIGCATNVSPEVRKAVQYLDVEMQTLTDLTAAMHDALRRGNHQFFRRVADALEWFTANTRPVDLLRASLELLASGLRKRKKKMTTAELSAWLHNGNIAHNADTLRRICKELSFPIRKSRGGRPQGSRTLHGARR